MNSFEQLRENLRLAAIQLPVITIKDIIEIIMIAFVIYHVLKWVRGTRAWMLVKGIVVLLFISAFAMILELNTILWIFANTINVGIIALMLVFQPELRRALEQLGRRNFFASFILFDDQKDKKEGISNQSVEEIAKAVWEMSKYSTGALIVLEQDIKLDEYVRTGIPLDALVSSQLLINIFEHNTPLHDGAIVIRNNRVIAATCYLPLSDNMSLSKELGTRHRAGVGISEVSDAMVIIISEETGGVSLALGGNLIRNIDYDYLTNKLVHVQNKIGDLKKFKLWKGRHKHG